MRRIGLCVLAAALLIAPSMGEAAKSKRVTACPDDAVCIWEKKNYRGDREVIDKKGVTNVSAKLNNEASSLKNRVGVDELAFAMNAKNGRLNSDLRCLIDSEYPDLGDIEFNDKISSILRPRPGDLAPLC